MSTDDELKRLEQEKQQLEEKRRRFEEVDRTFGEEKEKQRLEQEQKTLDLKPLTPPDNLPVAELTTSAKKKSSQKRNDCGTVLIAVAVVIFILLGFSCLCVFIGASEVVSLFTG